MAVTSLFMHNQQPEAYVRKWHEITEMFWRWDRLSIFRQKYWCTDAFKATPGAQTEIWSTKADSATCSQFSSAQSFCTWLKVTMMQEAVSLTKLFLPSCVCATFFFLNWESNERFCNSRIYIHSQKNKKQLKGSSKKLRSASKPSNNKWWNSCTVIYIAVVVGLKQTAFEHWRSLSFHQPAPSPKIPPEIHMMSVQAIMCATFPSDVRHLITVMFSTQLAFANEK